MIHNLINVIKSDKQNNYNLHINKNSNMIYSGLKEAFSSNKSVKVQNVDTDEDLISVFKNGKLISKSSVEEIGQSILYTNSDQYKTQKNQLNLLIFPESILSLQNEVFELKGYPKAYNQKLILILISRYIEQLSYNNGGIHHATFQKISRLNDERGTKQVYNELADKMNELHLYGQLDKKPVELNNNINFHFGSSKLYKYSWIVIHLSKDSAAALVAIENENKYNEWKGIWTFDRDKVIKLNNAMEDSF